MSQFITYLKRSEIKFYLNDLEGILIQIQNSRFLRMGKSDHWDLM